MRIVFLQVNEETSYQSKFVDAFSAENETLSWTPVSYTHLDVYKRQPFNAIDPESTSIIKKILFDLKDTGKMILFSVHNLDLVSNFCDKIIFIDNRHSIFECNNPQNFDVLEKIFFDKCVIKK